MKDSSNRLANVIELFVHISMAILLITFIRYLTGTGLQSIQSSKLTMAWTLPASQILSLQGLTPGWSWITHLDKSDILCMGGVAILAISIIVGYIVMLPPLFIPGKRRFAFIVLLQIIVLLLALSGFVSGGQG